jgi:NAD(P)-dependent dehydrogenase (short-subunit alcohol dehydrogenase family)
MLLLGSENCLTRRVDVSDKAEFGRAMEEFSEASGGRLDLLFNNAGIGAGGWFEEVPYEVAMRVLEVNCIGVVNGVYAGIPLLKRTPNSLCFSTLSSAALFGSRAADMMPALIDTPILESTLDCSVAELVWEAYCSDRVHWYIPAEMEGVDKARAGGVEPLRDQFKKTVLEER